MSHLAPPRPQPAPPAADKAAMRLCFDRGTLLLLDAPADLASELPGVAALTEAAG